MNHPNPNAKINFLIWSLYIFLVMMGTGIAIALLLTPNKEWFGWMMTITLILMAVDSLQSAIKTTPSHIREKLQRKKKNP